LETQDDAGVFQISDDLALIQTVDFFTPIVDDPYDYGQIAVANSLSDIYAMGATPITALNIVGFPIATMDKKILSQILQGGWDKALEAGVTILGGHSVKDPEIKYGLAVTALAHPKKIIKNNTAKIGDKLILTKPIGTGILTTALKNEKLSNRLLKLVTENMKYLNRDAGQIMLKYQASACTDVTGFGLLGHLFEMTESGNFSVKIYSSMVPLLPDVLNLIAKKHIPGGLKENYNYLQPRVSYSGSPDDPLLKALYDPQTSGGLLFTISPEWAQACLTELSDESYLESAIIGEVIERNRKSIYIDSKL
jgi:selenide,water dikinase